MSNPIKLPLFSLNIPDAIFQFIIHDFLAFPFYFLKIILLIIIFVLHNFGFHFLIYFRILLSK